MAKTFNLNIVAPDGQVLDKDVEFLVVPGENGELGILPNHAPLIAGLTIGVLRYTLQDKVYKVAIGGGFMEVVRGKVTILANTAETKEKIRLDRAKEAKARAEKRLQERQPDIDVARAEVALKRAVARIKAADN